MCSPILCHEEVADGLFVWVAFHHNWPGVLAQAETREEAERIWQENLADRLQGDESFS